MNEDEITGPCVGCMKYRCICADIDSIRTSAPQHKRIAIVGSREYPDLDRVHEFVRSLPASHVIVSGQARGVDSEARQAALEHGMNVVDVPAIWKYHGRGAGFRRNRLIVELADQVVAFWDGKSKGTEHTIKTAIELQVQVIIIGPNGEIQ